MYLYSRFFIHVSNSLLTTECARKNTLGEAGGRGIESMDGLDGGQYWLSVGEVCRGAMQIKKISSEKSKKLNSITFIIWEKSKFLPGKSRKSMFYTSKSRKLNFPKNCKSNKSKKFQ